jgi:hypothetical protein
MGVIGALIAARKAGVKLSVDGDKIFAEAPKVPGEVVEALKATKSDLLRVLKCREVVTECDLVGAIVTYFAAYREWCGPPDMLLTTIGKPLNKDEDEATAIDRLMMHEDALAERGVALRFQTSGHVVLEYCQPRPPQTVSPLDAVGNSRSDGSKLEGTPATPLVWLRSSDRRWASLAARHFHERGEQLHARIDPGNPGTYGAGAFVPSHWVVGG